MNICEIFVWCGLAFGQRTIDFVCVGDFVYLGYYLITLITSLKNIFTLWVRLMAHKDDVDTLKLVVHKEMCLHVAGR